MEDQHKTNNLAFFYFIMQGIGSLVSWNAVLNGVDYFMIKYPRFDVYYIFPIAVTLAQLMCCFFILKISQTFSLNFRIMVSLLALMCILLFLPIQATLFAGSSFGFWTIIGLLFLMGWFNTILTASLSGIVSLFPGKYASYNMIGTSLAGLSMNALRALFIFSLKSKPNGDVIGILVYFGLSALLVTVCLVIHPIFVRSDFYRAHLVKSEEVIPSLAGEREIELIKRVSDSGASRKDVRAVLRAFKEVYIYLFLMLFTQIQTFTTFPGMMLKKHIDGLSLDWKLVTMVATFQASCIIGQKLAQFREYYNKWVVIFCIIIRTTFAVLFVVQAVSTDSGIISTAWFGYVNIVLFSVTFGFIQTSLFILAIESVQPDKKEVVGYMTVFGGVVGVALGAILSLPFRNVGTVELY